MENGINGIKVAILVTDGFEQVEMTGPRDALIKAGAKTQIISPEKKVRGWHHDKPAEEFPVDVNVKDANPGQYNALLLPGGVRNPDALRLVPEAIAFIKAFVTTQKPIAAICHGPWTLINAEGVKDRKMTSWPSIKLDLINAGAQWFDQEVVQDGNLITSRKPDDIPAFSKALIALLKKTS